MAQLTELKCPNCGAKLERVGDADQAMCPHCGAQLLIERKAVAVTPEAEALGCPLCRKVDRVQKVSAIYTSGVSTGRFSGWSLDSDADAGIVALSGRTQTEISKLLSPPKEPSYTDSDGVCLFLFFLLFGVPVLGGLMLGGFGLAMIYAAALVVGYVDPQVGPAGVLLLAIASLLMGCLGLAGVALFTRLMSKRGQHHRRRVAVMKASWEQAMHRWGGLYYCGRDDGVFIPGETDLIPTTEMREFLYAD